MQACIIIPTFDRPEFLWMCLDYIIRCHEAQGLEIRVHADRYDPDRPLSRDIVDGCRLYKQELNLKLHVQGMHPYHGNSYNLLEAYKKAYYDGFDHVFMIEDDVMVRDDFFDWHFRTQREHQGAVSIGVTNPGHGAYASLGVCIPRERLAEIIPHCRTEYYGNMRYYCQTQFPHSPFDVEQDGLWARVLKHREKVWATDPVCQHVGWYSYHRTKGIRPTGSVDERYEQLVQILTNPTILKEHVKDFQDVVPLQF